MAKCELDMEPPKGCPIVSYVLDISLGGGRRGAGGGTLVEVQPGQLVVALELLHHPLVVEVDAHLGVDVPDALQDVQRHAHLGARRGPHLRGLRGPGPDPPPPGGARPELTATDDRYEPGQFSENWVSSILSI